MKYSTKLHDFNFLIKMICYLLTSLNDVVKFTFPSTGMCFENILWRVVKFHNTAVIAVTSHLQTTVKQKERRSNTATPSPVETAEQCCCLRSLCVLELMSDASRYVHFCLYRKLSV